MLIETMETLLAELSTWSLCELICYPGCGVIIVFLSAYVLTWFKTVQRPSIYRLDNEKVYYDPKLRSYKIFPSLYEGWSVHLSVIVPAYNEEVRLPPMLDECLGYLRKMPKQFSYEVIVVSDGSTDNTVQVAMRYSEIYGTNTVRVLNLITNRGKGGAVCLGMMSARGAALLFADADGATKFEDLVKLEKSLEGLVGANYKTHPGEVAEKKAIVCGSRAHLEAEATATRSYFRTVLMHGFHLLVWLFTVRGVRDTQCGFKLMTRAAARVGFSNLHVYRWAFDVELLNIAEILGIPVSEVAVNWTEIEGSKIVPVLSWLQMGRDVFSIWLRYYIGVWRVKS